MSAKSEAEDLLYADLVGSGLEPERQYLFHPIRHWQLDFAWPAAAVAVEVDGRGRHQTAKGERGDKQKINAAAEFGWWVLVYPARSVTVAKRRALIVQQIRRVLCDVVCEIESSEVLEDFFIKELK